MTSPLPSPASWPSLARSAGQYTTWLEYITHLSGSALFEEFHKSDFREVKEISPESGQDSKRRYTFELLR